jgi:hypothetical protein
MSSAPSAGSTQGPQRDNWSWSITALYIPPGIMTRHGTADSKDDAKAAFGKTLCT